MTQTTVSPRKFKPSPRCVGPWLRLHAHGHLIRDDPRTTAALPRGRIRHIALTVGIIEGIVESTALITKVFSGALSDWLGKRKLLATVGYGVAAFTKPIFPLASTVEWLMFARFIDRTGKGIRGVTRSSPT